VARQGCWAWERRRTVIANEPGETARSLINPSEGALGASCEGLKQAFTRAYSGAAEVNLGFCRKVELGAGLAKVGDGAPAQAPPCDIGCQRSRRLGRGSHSRRAQRVKDRW